MHTPVLSGEAFLKTHLGQSSEAISSVGSDVEIKGTCGMLKRRWSDPPAQDAEQTELMSSL